MVNSNIQVSIVLATLNGAQFLDEQLRSICAQDHDNWQVILSDDGSSDETLTIARDCIPEQKLRILEGPKCGLALNFWNGLKHVPTGHYAAFCDQDDVWVSNKLTRAITKLAPIERPAIYSAGRYIADTHLNITNTQLRRRAGSDLEMFFRNRIAGHTCLLSPQAVPLLKRYPPSRDVPFHDWWTALILAKHGATFVHDPVPVLYYRQHGRNVIGARNGRAMAILSGQYTRWLVANYTALRAYRVCLPRQAGLSRKAR